MWSQIALVFALILLNGFLAGSEIALVSLREGQLRRLERSGPRGVRVAHLARDPNRFLSTIQIGITLSGFLASAAAATSLAQPLTPLLVPLVGRAAGPTAIVAVTLTLTFVTLVLGELVPKRLALQWAERWALVAARPLALLTAATRPAVWLLSQATDLAVRLAGGNPNAGRDDALSDEEFRDVLSEQADVTPQQRTILTGTLDLADRRLRDVLVPRRDVFALPGELPAAEGLTRMASAAHSRAPVTEGDLDHVLGIIALPGLVDASGTVADHTRQALVLPEGLGVLDALRRLQTERQQMALVVNEYGGTEGVITMEDLLEELVGEIYDEFDPDPKTVRRLPDGELLLPGTYPVHDLPDLGVNLPSGEHYTTVAGLVMQHAGRVPAVDDSVEINGWRLTVTAMERHAITRIRLVSTHTIPTGEPDDTRAEATEHGEDSTTPTGQPDGAQNAQDSQFRETSARKTRGGRPRTGADTADHSGADQSRDGRAGEDR